MGAEPARVSENSGVNKYPGHDLKELKNGKKSNTKPAYLRETEKVGNYKLRAAAKQQS